MVDLSDVQTRILKRLARFDNLGRVVLNQYANVAYDSLGRIFVDDEKICTKKHFFEEIKKLHKLFYIDAVFDDKEIEKPDGPDYGAITIRPEGVQYLATLEK